MILEKAVRVDEALEAIDKAIELSPEIPDLHHRRSCIFFMNNQIKEALEELNKALELKPQFPSALGTKSEILQTSGDMEGALIAIQEALDYNPDLPTLYFSFSKLHKFKEDDPELAKMVELAALYETHGTSQQVGLLFGLFKAYQDIKDYDKAFEYLNKGNELRRQSVSFDRQSQENLYTKMQQRYGSEFFDEFKDNDIGHQSDAPIFIVGMPRSGTTLTEQIISSHPKVFGAGELYYMTMLEKEMGHVSAENCKEMGEKYEQMVRDIAPEAKEAEKFTDKMPGNYMRIGQILASMPNAKIIHCRRNPIDTCLSCYKQLFSRGHYWSYNQEEMVEHYKLYAGMMEHWRETIPDKFIEIHYEDTVDDLEKQARMLIDFVGLEWDDACLTPHKTKRSVLTASKGQVRKPIYKTSVEAWRRYEDQFATVAEGLKDYVVKR
ncbi:MAG: sulfotransferase, partial [Pseudomonadota bacterium]